MYATIESLFCKSEIDPMDIEYLLSIFEPFESSIIIYITQPGVIYLYFCLVEEKRNEEWHWPINSSLRSCASYRSVCATIAKCWRLCHRWFSVRYEDNQPLSTNPISTLVQLPPGRHVAKGYGCLKSQNVFYKSRKNKR